MEITRQTTQNMARAGKERAQQLQEHRAVLEGRPFTMGSEVTRGFRGGR